MKTLLDKKNTQKISHKGTSNQRFAAQRTQRKSNNFNAEDAERARKTRNFLKKIPVHEWAVLPVNALTFSADLIDYCKSNACGNYGKSWTCPPGCGSVEEQRKKILSFKDALVFTTKHNIEDSFDYEGMTKGRKIHTSLTLEIAEKIAISEATQQTDFSPDPQSLVPSPHLVYGAGACPICEKCAFPEPCRFPEKQIGSIEAAGIDVTELSRAARIAYNNGPNTVTFFSMILTK